MKFDIKTAFLYGTLDEEIFMELSEGYKQGSKICKLNKTLYGLEQAPLKWNQRFMVFLQTVGLKPIKTKPSIYKTDVNSVIMAIYVDNGLVIGEDRLAIRLLIKQIRW